MGTLDAIVYGVLGVAGMLLLRRNELGEVFSYVAQGLQVLSVTKGAVALRFIAGLQASVFFLGDRVTGYVGATASISIWRGPADPPFAIGVNLIPIAVVLTLACLPSR